jgi:hypothetical protein
MMGRLSLAEELRAIRGGANSKSALRHPPEPDETKCPWKPDIERVERTLREALQTISQISGVELSDGSFSSQGEKGSLSRLDCATLKDRIRNDLEAFSATTVSEMSKQAEQKARATLDAIQSEVSSRIEQVIGEYREKLKDQIEPQQLEIDVAQQSRDRVEQLVQAQTDEFARWVWLTCKGTGTPIPLQIEKLLEPYVEEATARVTGSINQRIQDQIDEQEKLVHERLEGTTNSIQSHLSTLEQAAQEICQRNTDSVMKISTDHLNAATDQAEKNLESRVRAQIDASFAGVQTRLDETVAALLEEIQQKQDQRAQAFMRRMDALASEVEVTKTSEVSSRIERAAAQITESSLQNLEQRAQELSNNSKNELHSFLQQETEGTLGRIQEVGRSVHESLEQDAARVMDRFKGLDKDLAGMRQRYLGDCQGELYSMVKEAVGSLEPNLRQIAEDKMAEVGAEVRKSQDETVAQFESRLREVSEGQYHEMLERIWKDAGEAGAQASAEVRTTSQSVLQELSDKVDASAAILREQQAQASSYFESSMNDTLETFRQQLAQIAEAGKKEQQNTIVESVADLQNRLKQAAEFLSKGFPTSA